MRGCRRFLGFVWVLVALGVASPPASAISATWLGSPGDWSDPTQWSSDPSFPDNSTAPFDWDVLIESTDEPLGVPTLDQDVTITDLTMNLIPGMPFPFTSPSLENDGFTLTVEGTLAGSGRLNGTGTTIVNGAIDAAGNLVSTQGITVIHNGSTTILPDETFSSDGSLINSASGTLVLAGDATLGVAEINGHTLSGGSLSTGEFENLGVVTLSAADPFSLLRMDVTNRGLLEIPGGRLDVDDVFLQPAGTLRLGDGTQGGSSS